MREGEGREGRNVLSVLAQEGGGGLVSIFAGT